MLALFIDEMPEVFVCSSSLQQLQLSLDTRTLTTTLRCYTRLCPVEAHHLLVVVAVLGL